MDDGLQRIAHRVERVQKLSMQVREHIKHTDWFLTRASADVAREAISLHEELDDLDEQTKLAIEKVKQVVLQFRQSVKIAEVKRLEQRIDGWGPQHKISRDQFKKLLS